MGDTEKDSVCIRFVLREQCGNEDETAHETRLCFKNCQEYNLEPSWIEEKLCLELQPTKRDVFVCEKFEGVAFEYLRNFKSVILGPRVLLSSFQEGVPIPPGGTTIFTLAMKDLMVTSTNFTEEEKNDIEEKVGFMGGFYAKRLVGAVTHLVANGVRSVKYEKAAELSIPVMTAEWVESVWAASQVREVLATDAEFEAYKCLPFHNLNISCTNLMRAEKDRVKALIEDNGGVFSGALESERTKILVVKDKNSKKYNFARLWHLPCVVPAWVYKSVKAGYALNVSDFEIEKVFARKCSTPVQDSQGHLPDISTISSIGCESHLNRKQVDETRMDETRMDETATSSAIQNVASECSSGRPGDEWTKKYVDVIRKLDVREAKKAGNFLDGCNVYLSGFTAETNEKLRRVLNGGGATRYDEISAKVSHIVVGKFVAADMKVVRTSSNRPHVVTADWIIESIKLRCPAPEDQFSCLDARPPPAEPPSPSLKKGLQLLQSKAVPVPFPPMDDSTDEEADPGAEAPSYLIPQYLNQETTRRDIAGNNLFKDTSKENTSAKENATGNGEKRPTQQDATQDCSSMLTDGEGTQLPMFFTVPWLADVTNCAKLHNNKDGCREWQWSNGSGRMAEPRMAVVYNNNKDGCREWQWSLFKGAFSVEKRNNLTQKSLTFLVVGFTDGDGQDQESCEAVVERYGGRVVSRAFKGIPDYGVVPFQGATLHHPTNEVVTSLWLEDCQFKGELLPIEYYHQPVALPPTDKLLQGVVLGFSTYSGKEREFLSILADGLGAIPQEVFARRDNKKKNAVASTHLVCKDASGTKYEAAIKWNIPAVSHKWLLACLRERQLVPVDEYLVGEDSLTQNSTALDLNASEHTPATKPVPENLPPAPNVEGPSSSRGRPTAPKPSALLPPAVTTPLTTTRRDYGFSQETPIRFPRLSTGTPQPRRSVAGAADRNLDSPLVTTGDTPRLPGQVATPETPYGVQPNPSPETRKRMLDWVNKMPEFEKDVSPVKKVRRLSTPTSVLLKRCWTKFGDNNAEGADTTLAGGSETADASAADNCTPNRYAGSDQMDTSVGLPPEVEAKPPGAGINTQLNQLNEILMSSPSTEANTAEEAPKLPLRRPSILESGSQKSLVVANSTTENKTIETAVKESQSDVIGWADHSRHNTKDQETSSVAVNAEEGTQDPDPIETPPPRFMLSSVENRERYVKIIKSLGGLVTESETFDPTATHLVCTKTTRSEKLLACIASGKWILHNSFLDDSHARGRFLSEEPYEWGNPAAEEKIGRLATQSLDYKLAKAAHRWRKKLAGTEEGGAFTGIRAIVHTNKERIGAIKRLVMAGGGSIVEARFPFSDPGSATHCFVERNKIHSTIDLKALKDSGVLCLESIFLNNFLIENPPPVDSACVVPAYRALMRQ